MILHCKWCNEVVLDEKGQPADSETLFLYTDDEGKERTVKITSATCGGCHDKIGDISSRD